MKYPSASVAAFSAVSIALLLSSCGGGGGGELTAEQPRVSLSGFAAKGLLKGAQATAFEFKNGNWVEVAQVTTGNDGSYSFTSLSPTPNLVKVEIKAIAGTKMLDESQIENGAYKEVDAPNGLTIRTMVEKLEGDRANINANPFTEMAVEAALTAKDETGALLPPTSSTWTAARTQIMTLLPAGVTPESIRPLSPSETPTTDQATVMTLITGLAASGDIATALNDMRSAFAVEINQTTGTFSVPQAKQSAVLTEFAELNIAGNAKLNELAMTNPALKLFSFKDNTTDYSSKIFLSKTFAVEEARNSLASFVDVIKVSYETVGLSVSKATQDFDARVSPLVFDLAATAINEATLPFEEVELNTDANGYLVLTQVCGQTCRFSLTKTADGAYTFIPKSPGPISGPLSVTGSLGSDYSLNLFLEGSAKSAVTNRTVSSLSLSITSTDVIKLDLGSGTISIESLMAKAYDDSGAVSATLSITDGKLINSNSGEQMTLEGTIALLTSMGDELEGNISVTQISTQGPYGYYEDVPLSLKASLTGILANVNVASISVEALNTTTKANYFNDDKQTSEVSLTVILPGASGGSEVKLSAKETITLEQHSINGTISSGGNSFTFEEADVDGPSDVPLVITSSTGEFRLALDDDGNGDLLKGSAKIGEAKEGVLYYDSVQQSLF